MKKRPRRKETRGDPGEETKEMFRRETGVEKTDMETTIDDIAYIGFKEMGA